MFELHGLSSGNPVRGTHPVAAEVVKLCCGIQGRTCYFQVSINHRYYTVLLSNRKTMIVMSVGAVVEA